MRDSRFHEITKHTKQIRTIGNRNPNKNYHRFRRYNNPQGLFTILAMSTVIKGKIIKRKKKDVEFTAENIDSTAPVNKILDDLQHKNKQAFAFYNYNIRQRASMKKINLTYHYTLPGHSLNKFTPEWDGDLPTGYFEPFPYKCLNPKIITKMKNIDKCDPVIKELKLRDDWSRACKTLRISAGLSNVLNKYESFNEEVVQCPKHLIDVAVHMEQDPDPYFDSSYNWYYAGNGNLQIVCVNWVDYLLHSEFSTVYLSQFCKNEMTVFDNDHSAIFDCDGNNIFETICSSDNIVVLRTKKKIYILKISTTNDDLEFENIQCVDSDLPFTSINFDNHHKNILYITSLDSHVKIVNLNRLTCRTVKFKTKNTSLVNNWNAVISSDRVNYVHVTKNSIEIYDKRTHQQCHMWNSLRDITDDVTCNDITVATQCEQSNSLYFGTDHHLFLMDVRHQKQSKPSVLQRWTHGMQSVPTYISICNFTFNKQLICLNSQWCEDNCLISNYATRIEECELSGVTMPYRPPSILNVLSEAREKLLCLDLYNPIDRRLTTSITGSQLMEQGENYIMLMQNSLGDISFKTLYPEHMDLFVTEDSHQHLHDWSKSYHIDRDKFEVSSIEDFGDIWKNLKRVPEHHKVGEGKLIKTEQCKFSEKEIYDTFESEEIEVGLLDIWVNSADEKPDESAANGENTSLDFRLYFSESD